jgi:GMP synthase (glutamine-hydrolysing)
MILIINNSNRNKEIKTFIQELCVHNKIKTPFKKTIKKFKNGKNLNFVSKKHTITLKYLTDKLLYILDTLKIDYKNILSIEDLIEVIKSGEKVTGLIFSGSDLRLSFNNIPFKILSTNIMALEYFSDVPMFGICFGFQFLHQYFGGEVGKVINFSNKIYKIKINKPGWFFKRHHSGNYKFFNADIVSAMGNGFSSKTSYYENEGLAVVVEHQTKKIIGTQFHPEISGKQGTRIIKDFCKLCLDEAKTNN